MNKKPEKQFKLTSVSSSTYLFLIGLTILPLFILAILWALNPGDFTNLPIWMWPVILLLGPLIIIAAQGIRNPNVVLSNESLSIKVSFLKKKWTISELLRDQIRVVNLDEDAELKPKWKLFGASVPGLRSGYFRLNNKQNAHVYLTDFQKVVYIPTQKGPLLLSLQRPKEFMDHLQSV